MKGRVAVAPARVVVLDISGPLPSIESKDPETGMRCGQALCLVRYRDKPIGVARLILHPDEIPPEDAAAQIRRQLARVHPELRFLTGDGLPASVGGVWEPAVALHLDPVSVVIATRDRPRLLERCLQSVLRVDYPEFEIIVVDNAPASDAGRDVVIGLQQPDQPRIRYVRESRPGLSIAHNAGLAVAENPIVAFTDDDVVVDPRWMRALAGGFNAEDDVAAVTGMIFPYELATPAQIWTEQFAGFNKGTERRIFDLDRYRPADRLFPFTAGSMGSGANMAFRTDHLRSLGGFDAALGTGTASRGGDDLAAFYSVIRTGHRLVYEPAAIVYHSHHRQMKDLRRQAFGYGMGLGAYLTEAMMDDPAMVWSVAARMPAGLTHVFSPRSPKNAGKGRGHPRSLGLLERLGMLAGPFGYLKARRSLRARAGAASSAWDREPATEGT